MHTTAHGHQNDPPPSYPTAALPSLSMGRAAVPPTHGAAASLKLAQGLSDRVWQCHSWFLLGGANASPIKK